LKREKKKRESKIQLRNMSSELINNLNTSITYLYKYVLLTIYILGNFGNIFSFLLFLRKSWRKKVCVFYFQVALFFNTCYLNCTTIGLTLINGFSFLFHNQNNFMCKGYFYFSFVFATISPTILILASIDRLLISSQNVDTRLYSSKRLAYFSISVSIIFWILVNIHLLFKVNMQQPYPFLRYCYYDSSEQYLNIVSISSTSIHVIFFVLMIALCLLSFKNVKQIRIISSHQRQVTRSMTKKDFQLLRCLFVQDLVFILFGMLIIINYLYMTATSYQTRTVLRSTIENFLKYLFNLFYAVPFAADFFVFILVSKAFRSECKRIVCRTVRKRTESIQNNEHRF